MTGKLFSAPSTSYRLEFFAGPSCDPSGQGQGAMFVGSLIVTTQPTGMARVLFTSPNVVPGQLVTATATHPADGTSEFSTCVVATYVAPPPPPEECAEDEDGDGEVDAADGCPGTPASAPVDAAGCSLPQFCAVVDAASRQGSALCKRADWQNDEPLMKPRDADCKVDKGGKGRTDDRCVPR